MQEKPKPLNRVEGPPPRGPDVWIVRVRPKIAFVGQIVSDSVWGVMVHWEGRTRECNGEENCERCHAGLSNKYLGYLYCWDSFRKEYIFLELTGDAVEELWRLAGTKDKLRGLIIEARRRGDGPKTGLVISIREPVNDTSSLPEPRDPEEVLRRLWGWKKGVLKKSN